MASVSEGTRRTHPALRIWFCITASVVILGGVQLYLLTENTEKYFAWTIAVPISAAVLGAFYFTGAPLLFLYAAQKSWARTRAILPGMFVFVTMILIMTLTHLDEFHLQSDDPGSAVTSAIIWLVLYIVEPPALALLYLLQRRQPGTDAPVVEPLPNWLRAYFGAVGVLFVVLGIALFLLPATMADIWPWPLAELSSMAFGSWFTGLGLVMAFTTILENDLDRLFPVSTGYAILGALHVVAIVRYSGDVDFGNVLAWIDVVLFASLVIVGIYGAVLSSRLRSRGAAPARPADPAIPAMP